jgi:hypothetical protein
MLKAAAANSAAEAAAGSTNSFTSARVAVFNPPRGLEEVAAFLSNFSFLPKDFRSRK